MPTVTTSNLTQIGNNSPDGLVIGAATAADGTAMKIAMFGGTPAVQTSGAGQAALVRGNAGGSIATYATTQSPAAVANITSGEKGLTVLSTSAVYTIASGDMLIVNKPTSQAGLGVGNVRVSAANSVGLTFSNFTAATITPTSSETYGIVGIRGLGNITVTLTPAAVAANTIIEQQFNVPGLRSGSTGVVQVAKPTAQAGLDIVGVRAVSSGVAGVTFCNVSAATITPTAGESYIFWEAGGIDATDNLLVAGSLQSPAAVANATSAEQALTVTGLLASDIIVGVSKPTAQAGIGLVGWRVTGANTLGLTFMNSTAATVTPTAAQVYSVTMYRGAPAAPMVNYAVTLTPTSVAANTTAEQTFTVTGLVSGSMVWVNKPSWTNGLGVAGVRVSAADTLAINFCNVTAAAITPPSETYKIANFQKTIPDAGCLWYQNASQVSQTQSILSNAMRTALVNMNLMLGS